jgi:hypothetical protein
VRCADAGTQDSWRDLSAGLPISHALSRAWDNISPVPVTGVTGEARIADDLPDPSDTRAWTNSSSDTCGLVDWLSTSANFGASHAAGAIRPFRCVLGQ